MRLGVVLVVVLASSAAHAEGLRAEGQAEYLWPTHADREISTVSLHALLGQGFFSQSWLSWRAGLTTSYAWGNIEQLDDQFRSIHYDNAALGVGPVGLLRLQTPPLARLSVGGDASGGLLLYTQHFPAGGDVYNFMWRAGVLLEYRASAAVWAGAGFHVMHVSNGQGLGPHNPSYEGRGVAFWLSFALTRADDASQESR